MFGFGKKAPLIQGPVEFEAQIEIDCAPQDLYQLIDISSPQYAQTQLGNTVSGSENSWTLKMAEMEDLTFCFTVLKARTNEQYAYECVIEPQFGYLEKSTEDYRIEPRGDAGCTLTLTVSAKFDDDLTDEEIAQEIAMMSAAVDVDLRKLKVHAEQGLEARLAMEGEEEWDIDLGDIDLGDIDLGDITFEN